MKVYVLHECKIYERNEQYPSQEDWNIGVFSTEEKARDYGVDFYLKYEENNGEPIPVWSYGQLDEEGFEDYLTFVYDLNRDIAFFYWVEPFDLDGKGTC